MKATMTRTTKAERDALELIYAAEAAAAKAFDAAKPTPMIVGTAKALFGPGANEIDRSEPTYYVAGGVCGFAGVVITPARGTLVRMLKATRRVYPNHGGGLYVPMHYGQGVEVQSLERQEAAGRAYAAVLTAAGIRAYMTSRMD